MTKSAVMPRVTELRADKDWLGPVLDPLIAAHASIAKQLKIVSASVLDAAREDADELLKWAASREDFKGASTSEG